MNYPDREGLILGSISMPLFDQNRRMRQGHQRLLAWPLEKIDERYICMGDYYKYKEKTDIDYNFTNNLSIDLKMPLFHQEVFWDLGIDLEQFMKQSEIREESIKKKEDAQARTTNVGKAFKDLVVDRNNETQPSESTTDRRLSNFSGFDSSAHGNQMPQVYQENL